MALNFEGKFKIHQKLEENIPRFPYVSDFLIWRVCCKKVVLYRTKKAHAKAEQCIMLHNRMDNFADTDLEEPVFSCNESQQCGKFLL